MQCQVPSISGKLTRCLETKLMADEAFTKDSHLGNVQFDTL